MYNVRCTMYNVQCIMYNVHCTHIDGRAYTPRYSYSVTSQFGVNSRNHIDYL